MTSRRVLLVAIVLFAVDIARGDDRPRVPADRSLTVAEYMERGLPDPAFPWSWAQRDAANDLLWSIWETDPALLPRAESPRSREVFQRLLEQEFRSTQVSYVGLELADADPAERREILQRRSLVAIYELSLEDGLLFDRELIEIAAERLRSSMEAVEFMLAAPDRTREIREQQIEQGLEAPEASTPNLDPQVADALLLLHAGNLVLLTASDGFSMEARAAGLIYLERAVADSTGLLTPDARSRLSDVLAQVRLTVAAERASTADEHESLPAPAPPHP